MAREKLTNIAHKIIEGALIPGNLAVDATAGNGFDTAFLARLIGKEGRVLAFDIQEEALRRTKELLENEGLFERATLINSCHSKLPDYVKPKSASAIMFNLGFLPRSDRKIVTSPETTKTAILAGIDALEAGGVMTVIAYRGHEGGEEEENVINQLFSQSQSKNIEIQRTLERDDNLSNVLFTVFKSSCYQSGSLASSG